MRFALGDYVQGDKDLTSIREQFPALALVGLAFSHGLIGLVRRGAARFSGEGRSRTT